jgi:hypothetical protein
VVESPLQVWTCETRQFICFQNRLGRHRIDIARKFRKRFWVPTMSQTWQGKFHYILRFRNNPLCFHGALSFGPIEAEVQPSGPLGQQPFSWGSVTAPAPEFLVKESRVRFVPVKEKYEVLLDEFTCVYKLQSKGKTGIYSNSCIQLIY